MTDHEIETLRAYRETLDPSLDKNALAYALIMGCLDLGIRRRRDIRDALAQLGFKPSHVVIYLDESCGSATSGMPWGKASDGEYFEHNRAAV